jgi:DNA-binding GntR family transcriptional regulator
MSGEVSRIGEDSRLQSVRIADEIRCAVLSGEMLPGTRVGQEWLASKFGASRIPVREALRQLQNEGLVILAPNRGAWIADVTSQESIEVYKIREVLEPLAIFESVPHLTDDDIASLDATVRRLEQVNSVQEYIPLDREFHLKTYCRAPMPNLRGMIERYWNSTQHFRRWFVKDSLAKDGLPFSDPQHLLLMETIRARDAEGASCIVRLHIRRTRLLIEKMGGGTAAPSRVPRPSRAGSRHTRRDGSESQALNDRHIDPRSPFTA